MKKFLGFLVLVLMVSAGCLFYYPNERGRAGTVREDPYDSDQAPYGSLDTGYFYDHMQPYGLWVSYAPYGYVWIPNDVGYNWRPYTRGRWAWTDYGWTWVSLERWGWIAFHYGRWGFDRRLGWFWVPDIVWGPAWVAWRWGDAHIGWAPLPPGSDFDRGRGFGRRNWDIPGHHWNFVRGRYFLDRSLDRYVLPNERNVTIINFTDFDVNINVRGDRVVNDGVDVERVGRLTNRVVDRYSLKEASGEDQERLEGRDVVLYKPNVAKNEAARPKQVLGQEKAAEQLDNERSGRITRRVPLDNEANLRQAHEQEKELMEESQEVEINEIRRKTEDEKTRIQAPAEKQKVEEQVKSKVAELKKKHDEEKAELTRRQKGEEEKVKKAPVRKKIERIEKIG
jgi:hypothetical protein